MVQFFWPTLYIYLFKDDDGVTRNGEFCEHLTVKRH